MSNCFYYNKSWLRWMINNGRKKLFSLLPILRISMFPSTSRGFPVDFTMTLRKISTFCILEFHVFSSNFGIPPWNSNYFYLTPWNKYHTGGGGCSHIAKTSFKMSFFICITFYWEALGNNYFYVACPFLS